MRLNGLLTIFMVSLLSIAGYAQEIRGTVTDDGGLPLIGATLLEKGTANGTTTDEDGAYAIKLNSSDATLVISYTGYAEQEISVNGQTSINVTMAEGSVLDEVVITALGISKEKKSLGYSVTQVSGEELSRVKSSNPLQAIRGKVAGVNISNNAGGVKGSTRVVIRGNSTFGGSNQPLYIIDGISLQNQQLGSAGEWGGVDNGDGLSAINPDDIKSINVLKGGAAAALYGSRASNGVIIIETKNGSGGPKGLGVEYNNQTVFTTINNEYDPQTTYGNGVAGGLPASPKDIFNSWGPAMDGSSRPTHDGTNQPYSYAGDNLERLYETGFNMTNSVAFTSNTDKGNTRLSFTHLDGQDVVATSKLNRMAFSLNTSQRLSDKLVVNASVKYTDTKENSNPIVATAPMSPNGIIRSFAPNINVNDFLGDFGNGTVDGNIELSPTDNIFNTNPWFAYYNNITSANKDRLLGAVNMRYDLTKNIYIRGQAGIDKGTNHFNNQVLNGAPLFQPGVAYNNGGQLFEQTQIIDQYDADLFIGTDNINLSEKLVLSGFVGMGRFSFTAEDVGVFGDQTVIPQLYTVLNTASQAGLYGYDAKQINSVYSSAELSFASKVYLSLTARNDWFSTLSAVDKTTPNNDLYGSASLSLILSDMVDLPEAITFAKLRGGYSQVAGGANDPYRLNLTYALVGQGHLGNPLGNINGGTIPNTGITPFEKNEIEVGLDMRLFKNRIGLDVALYSNQTIGDIVAATTSRASGFDRTTINLGEITNKGIELLLRGTVIESSDFSLDATLNYTHNKSEVIKTDENDGIIQAGVAALFQSNIGHMVGQPYGVIYGSSYVRDDQGRIVHQMVNDIPVPQFEAENKVLGLGVPPTQVGFGVNAKYKGFSLYAFLEGKFGGTIVSATNQSMKQYGLHQATVPTGGREAGFVPDGVLEDGTVITQSLNEEEYYHYWTLNTKYAVGEENAYKNDFIRFSQLSFGYQIPTTALANTPIRGATISLIGNNLGFLFNNVPNIDPEAYYSTGNGQGVEAIAMPIGKSIGFSVNLKF
jgi:TonB-linked SusC/RagA family outer membrane protein